jgi:hypothetical protein
MTSPIFLGLYLPIVVMTVAAAFLLLTRLVWPLMASKPDEVRENLIGVGAAGFALGVAIETPLYWAVRYFDALDWMANSVLIAGTPKMLYATSSVLLLAGLLRAVNGRSRLGLLSVIAMGLWATGAALSL